MLLVTGGMGFIGSRFILRRLEGRDEEVVNVDALTYAARPENLAAVAGDSRLHFVKGSVGDQRLIRSVLSRFRPRAVVHFAAETHVDRSIDSPLDFVTANSAGTCALLLETRDYLSCLAPQEAAAFRFINVSTDEVYGSLAPGIPRFTEKSLLQPSSPYSASKAAADMMAAAFHSTWGFPVITTHSSNTYGPGQYPEKLIPLVIERALAHRPVPIYGDGRQVRDWIHVDDHCRALELLLQRGIPGESYNIGADCEISNIELVAMILKILDGEAPWTGHHYAELVTHVTDRPGHDRRYGTDAAKLRRLGWEPAVPFAIGLRQTVRSYI